MGKGDRKSRKGKIRAKTFGNSRRRKRNKTKYISIKNLKCWSVEWLFAYVGQFDYSVNIRFIENSTSFLQYGKFINGTFYFTIKERKLLSIKINSGIKNETNKNVRFIPLPNHELNEDQVKKLRKEGFPNTDIGNLYYNKYQYNKTYSKKGIKKLQEPRYINIQSTESLVETLIEEYNLYKIRIDSSDSLIEYEKLRMMALQQILNVDIDDSKYVHKELILHRKEEFDFLLENIRFELGEIDSLSTSVLNGKSSKVKEVVNKEFQNAGINADRSIELMPYIDIYSQLIRIGMFYEDKIILYSTEPKIVLDFKGFMHVAFDTLNH